MKKRENIMEHKIFNIVKHKDNHYVITCGNYLVSEKKFKSIQAAKDYINTKPYELIFNTFYALLKIEQNENTKENQQNN